MYVYMYIYTYIHIYAYTAIYSCCCRAHLITTRTPLVSRLPTQRTGTTQGNKHVHIETRECALKRKSTTPEVLQTSRKYIQTILNQ